MKSFQLPCLLVVLMLAGCRTMLPGDLVEIRKRIPNVVLDLRYATTNNFAGRKLYESSRCFLRQSVTEKLASAQAEFNGAGLGLKIFDGYRPLSVQRKLWAIVPDENFVANPAKGSRHNRGAAVDVTLIRLVDGTELPMPTAFDDFTERAHRDYRNLPAEVIQNRDLLERVMVKHGFVGLRTEWWHFDDANWQRFDLLDVPVK